jgi:ATP-binding cassette subfamily B protein
MSFLKVYGRVLGLLEPVRGLALGLTFANLGLAAVPFLDPILFGKAIDLLTQASARGADATFRDGVKIFGLWTAVGVVGIVAGILVSLHADRLAHRQRHHISAQFFEHVLQLHLAYHRSSHSGRLLKIMLQGGDHLFGLWLSMFREHLSTLVSMLVLLPMTLFPRLHSLRAASWSAARSADSPVREGSSRRWWRHSSSTPLPVNTAPPRAR